VAISLYGLAQNSYWTVVFLVPLLAFVLEQSGPSTGTTPTCSISSCANPEPRWMINGVLGPAAPPKGGS
jgi:hypothetical protein